MTFDLDLEHTLDARWPGVYHVQVWWRSGHLSARRSDLRKSLQTDGRTDRRRTPHHCISSLLEWAYKIRGVCDVWGMDTWWLTVARSHLNANSSAVPRATVMRGHCVVTWRIITRTTSLLQLHSMLLTCLIAAVWSHRPRPLTETFLLVPLTHALTPAVSGQLVTILLSMYLYTFIDSVDFCI